MPKTKTASSTPELLDKLVNDYYALDTQIKKLTEQKDPLNKTIKHIMREYRLNVHTVKDLKVEYRLQGRRTLVVEKALEKLKELGVDPENTPELWKSTDIELLSVKKQ